jgi:PilZ domain
MERSSFCRIVYTMASMVPIKCERRTEVRMLCSELVRIRWEEPLANQCVAAVLEDISPSGAGLQVEAPINEGARVSIEPPNCLLHGAVRYCIFREIGYFIGVRLDEGCRWSGTFYRPEHLLDIKAVILRGRVLTDNAPALYKEMDKTPALPRLRLPPLLV